MSVRAIAEALGADVSWDHDTRTVTIERHMTKIELPIGEKQVSIIEDGEKRKEELDVAAKIKDDRTMVPLRFVSEILGESVKWYEETGEIDIGLKKNSCFIKKQLLYEKESALRAYSPFLVLTSSA